MKPERKPRAYKIADAPYTKAQERGDKDLVKLATHIENWVTAYGKGKKITISEPRGKSGTWSKLNKK